MPTSPNTLILWTKAGGVNRMESISRAGRRREAATVQHLKTETGMASIYRTQDARRTGLLLLAPAVLFVGLFTALPFIAMCWVSLNNWSLITPPKFVGLANFEKAFSDRQFWVSLRFTLTYTAIITPILMVGGYLIALLVVDDTPLRRFTRGVVFAPVVIGLGASSLLWYWLLATDAGLVNRVLVDLGMIAKPVIWLGTDATRSNLAVIASVTWKVIGLRHDPVHRRDAGGAEGDGRGVDDGRRRLLEPGLASSSCR